MPEKRGELTVTAVYTAQTWRWGKLDAAELFSTGAARVLFWVTNFAMAVARLFRPDLPSLKHGLVQRHAILDAMLADSGCPTVLELAAGLSRRGASASADPGLTYVEVDLPPVVALKRRLLATTARGREVAARPNLRLVGAAIEDVAFDDLVGDGPVFVIAEGLMLYLDAAAQSALWTRLAAFLARRPGSALAFDLVPWAEQPKPGRVGRALESWFKRFTKGQSFAIDERTREDLTAQLRAAGFSQVEIVEPSGAPARWSIPFLDRRTQTVVFRATP